MWPPLRLVPGGGRTQGTRERTLRRRCQATVGDRVAVPVVGDVVMLAAGKKRWVGNGGPCGWGKGSTSSMQQSGFHQARTAALAGWVVRVRYGQGMDVRSPADCPVTVAVAVASKRACRRAPGPRQRGQGYLSVCLPVCSMRSAATKIYLDPCAGVGLSSRTPESRKPESRKCLEKQLGGYARRVAVGLGAAAFHDIECGTVGVGGSTPPSL